MANNLLAERTWRVYVGGVDVSNLDVDFEIYKSLRPEPNSCTVKVYNLPPEQRSAIEQLNTYEPKKHVPVSKDEKKTATARKAANNGYRAPKAGRIPVEVHAGYQGQTSLLFRGDLRRAISERRHSSWLTVIEGEDGGRSLITARVSYTIQKGGTLLSAVEQCAEAMGLGAGNVLEYKKQLDNTFRTGSVLDGQASRELHGILRRVRLSYSIQNGVLSITDNNKASRVVEATHLTADTGLIDAPRRNSTGEVEATCLLIPDIAPGAYVRLDSGSYPGTYQIQSVRHVGSTFGDPWYHKLALSPA